MTLPSLFPIWATDLVNVSARDFCSCSTSITRKWLDVTIICHRYEEYRARMPLLFELHFHLLFGNSDTLNS